MTKPELGVKRDCPECGARFYDLNKEPAHCPKCEHDFIPEALLKPRKPRREDEPAAGAGEAAGKTGEVSLEAAEKEQKAPASKRKPSLDGDESDDDDDSEIDGLGDLGIDLDDDDDDADDNTLLDDDDSEDDDVKGIVSGGKDEDM